MHSDDGGEPLRRARPRRLRRAEPDGRLRPRRRRRPRRLGARCCHWSARPLEAEIPSPGADTGEGRVANRLELFGNGVDGRIPGLARRDHRGAIIRSDSTVRAPSKKSRSRRMTARTPTRPQRSATTVVHRRRQRDRGRSASDTDIPGLRHPARVVVPRCRVDVDGAVRWRRPVRLAYAAAALRGVRRGQWLEPVRICGWRCQPVRTAAPARSELDSVSLAPLFLGGDQVGPFFPPDRAGGIHRVSAGCGTIRQRRFRRRVGGELHAIPLLPDKVLQLDVDFTAGGEPPVCGDVWGRWLVDHVERRRHRSRDHPRQQPDVRGCPPQELNGARVFELRTTEDGNSIVYPGAPISNVLTSPRMDRQVQQRRLKRSSSSSANSPRASVSAMPGSALERWPSWSSMCTAPTPARRSAAAHRPAVRDPADRGERDRPLGLGVALGRELPGRRRPHGHRRSHHERRHLRTDRQPPDPDGQLVPLVLHPSSRKRYVAERPSQQSVVHHRRRGTVRRFSHMNAAPR